MRRREFMALIGGLAIAWSLACYAQEPKQPLKRVGHLAAFATCPPQPDNLIVRRLGELGWIEGQTIVFDCVSAIGRIDQVPALARELVSRRPDVLIASPYHFVSALKQETATIPIAMIGTWEPVRLGLITNFARPEGNVTGVVWFGLIPKQMELLKEIVPNLRRVAFVTGILGAANEPPEASKIGQKILDSASSALGFTWKVFGAGAASDYDDIFARIAAEHFDAAYIGGTPFNSNNATRICQLAVRYRIPTVGDEAGWARTCGLLLTYGQDFPWSIT